MALEADLRVSLYRWMRTNRTVEERLTSLYRQGRITGGLYRSLGQEATSVGSAAALARGDIMAAMIRNLGSLLVRGVRARDLFAQYMARGDSPTGGKDNVVHFGTTDGSGHYRPDHQGGLVSCISPLGNLPAVLGGMTLAARLQGRNVVGLTYTGDGAIATGEFHEGMNFLAALRLPVVVVLENNGWAYSTPGRKESATFPLAHRAQVYGCPGVIVDGQDVEAVFEATQSAVERARRGDGPTLIEARTYRMLGHAQHDDQSYVPKEELEAWAARDPLAAQASTLVRDGALGGAELAALDAEVASEVDAEMDIALAMGTPDPECALAGTYNDPAMDGWARRSKRGGFAPPS